VAIEEQEVAGAKLELFVINFEKDKMTLRVPTAKVPPSACASSPRTTGQARAGNAQGPRPHQAHHVVAPRAGIRGQDQLRRHHGHRRGGARPLPLRSQPEQSYSERQLYEAALDRLAREIAAVRQRRRSLRSWHARVVDLIAIAMGYAADS
jgi:CarD family transcriptional regulator